MIKKFVKYKSISIRVFDAFVEKVKEVSGGNIFYTEEKITRKEWFKKHAGTYSLPGVRITTADKEELKRELKEMRERKKTVFHAINNARILREVTAENPWDMSVYIRSDGEVTMYNAPSHVFLLGVWKRRIDELAAECKTLDKLDAGEGKEYPFMDGFMNFEEEE